MGLKWGDFHLKADQEEQSIESLVDCLPLSCEVLRKLFYGVLMQVSPITWQDVSAKALCTVPEPLTDALEQTDLVHGPLEEKES